ncbi:MAG: hypothetical protein HYY40_12715 [Bacteroidetes bacterium]|nr:hypothetical protein [Bacteroidota bacterium]
MKLLCTILLALVFLFPPWGGERGACQPGTQDAVYLKSGNIYRGIIVEHVIGNFVKIEISGGSILVFRYDEIEKMTKELLPDETGKKFPSPETALPFEKGIGGNLSWGFNTGEDVGISLLFSMDYIMKYHYGIGMGMGIESFNRGYFPIFLTLQYRPIKSTSGPFIYNYTGYSAPATDNNREYRGGVLAEAGLGFYAHLSNSSDFTFSVGYRYQESSFSYRYNNWNGGGYVDGKDYFRRIALRMGLVIH